MAAPPIAERHLHHFHRRSPIKESVRVATTANITLSGTQTIDGIAVIAEDRVLVKDETSASGNGLYRCQSGAWVRDYDESTDDPAFGYLVFVREGSTNGGTLWKNTNTSAPTLGSTSLTFAQFAGSGLSDPMTTRGDVIVRNASNVTARLGKGAADTFLHSDGTDVGYAAVTDAMLSTSDITTNNVSTSKHGFAPKAPNDATKFLDGTGAYSVPAGSGGSGAPLGVTRYANGADGGTYTIASATQTDVDATNAKVTFTAPASGNVVVDLCAIIGINAGNTCYFGLRESTTDLGTAAVLSNNAGPILRLSCSFYLTGVSAGSHTYKFAWSRQTSGTLTMYTGPTNGSVEMTVWAA